MTKQRLLVLCCLLLASILGGSVTLSNLALASTNYNDLMSPAVFDNLGSMSAAQIDSFLNTFPSSCISTNHGFTANEPTGYKPTSSDVNGIWSYGGPVSAGRVIYDAAKSHKLNPQVLIATLEKEEGLVSGGSGCSVWRYTSAMGYSCTDSGTNTHNYSYPHGGLITPLYYLNGHAVNSISGSCVNRAAKAGFSEQVIHAAWFLSFSRHRAAGESTWAIVSSAWNHCDDNNTCPASMHIPSGWACYSWGFMIRGTWARCSGGSTTFYDGKATIDGSSITISNGPTAAFYGYTPHKHGNDVLVTLFTNWFGSTIYQWAADITGQKFYGAQADCQSNTNQISLSGASFQSGQRYWVKITAVNSGSKSWKNTWTRLGTASTHDHASALDDGSWPSTSRAATLVEATVAPNATGTFTCFSVTAPLADGTYVDHLQIVMENGTPVWMQGDATFTLGITVVNPYNASLVSVQTFKDSGYATPYVTSWLLSNRFAYIKVRAKNIGSQTWNQSFTKVATASPANRLSAFCDSSWPSCSRATLLQESSVAPGQTGTFLFALKAPSTPAVYNEAFQLIADGQASGLMPNTLFTRSLNVVTVAPSVLASGQRLGPGDRVMSPDTKYQLVLQAGGNLILYYQGHAVWTSHTSAKPSSLVMQTGGNLILYRSSGGSSWSSHTGGHSGSHLSVQNSGNVVIYDKNNHVIWSTHTTNAH